jgi:hypothetical protein
LLANRLSAEFVDTQNAEHAECGDKK